MYETTGMRQQGNLWELAESLEGSPYYNRDLAPSTNASRTWNTWHITALWIGLAVCVSTYYLAAGLIKSGMSWWQAVATIFLGNLIVLVPMCLNAHAGTKYGVPFPVLLRAPFGVFGSNLAALLRAGVACGWFGIQTWIGGQAIYRLMGVFYPERLFAEHITFVLDLRPHFHHTIDLGLNGWQAMCYFLFWLINVFILVRGMESIKWMEALSAPLLIGVGLALLVWAQHGYGIPRALRESTQFVGGTLRINEGALCTTSRDVTVTMHPLRADDHWRPTEYRITASGEEDAAKSAIASAAWNAIATDSGRTEAIRVPFRIPEDVKPGGEVTVAAQFRGSEGAASSACTASIEFNPQGDPSRHGGGFASIFWISLTGMIGYWATLSLNIPDFTRFAKSQKAQVWGQFLGLPTTMAFYSFVGIAVTCAAVGIFKNTLVVEDAPWDPVDLLARFKTPWMVILSMVSLMIATLTTNVAANIVSPANDFSNLAPTKVSFRMGGFVAAILGTLIMPWKLMENPEVYINRWLVGYSSLLGPIGGIMIADYYVVRRARLRLPDLYKRYGVYRYCGGVSLMALFVLAVAVLPNVPGFLITCKAWSHEGFAGMLDSLSKSVNGHWDVNSLATTIEGLYQYAWFVGFGIAFVLYSLFGLVVRKV